MRNARTMMALVLSCCLALGAIAMAGCNKSPQRESMEMLRLLPADAEILLYYAVAKIREDEDLAVMYDDLTTQDEQFTSIGIDMDQVDRFAVFNQTTLLEGVFDMETAASLLNGNATQEDTYGDFRLWNQGWGVVAMTPDQVLMGSEVEVKACIDVLQGDAPSLNDNPDFRDVVQRLSEGFSLLCYASSLDDAGSLEGLLSTGMSIAKHTAETEYLDAVWKFSSDEAAETALTKVQTTLETTSGGTVLRLERRGAFLEATVEKPLEGSSQDES